MVGGMTNCTVSSVSDSQIICNLDSSSAGSKSIIINRSDQGNSNSNINYTFSLSISSLSNNQG
jgi:hypothetical protein